MKKALLFVLLLCAATASSQSITIVGAKNIAWDQPAISLAAANQMGAVIYVDALPKAVLAGKACTGAASPFTCTAPLPALTPGEHTFSVAVTLDGQESVKSNVVSVNVVILAQPQNLRIQ